MLFFMMRYNECLNKISVVAFEHLPHLIMGLLVREYNYILEPLQVKAPFFGKYGKHPIKDIIMCGVYMKIVHTILLYTLQALMIGKVYGYMLTFFNVQSDFSSSPNCRSSRCRSLVDLRV